MARPDTLSVVGFDSAWTDNPKAPGAVCSIRIDRSGLASLRAPVPADFASALALIREEQARSALCLVALDQPTIVPNALGMRPVDRVAASAIAWLGGGVQPANRSKAGMFDDRAPLWAFKAALAAEEDPELARRSTTGVFLIEVFPALALPSFDPSFFGRLKAPRYNPRRKTFRDSDWRAVLAAARACAERAEILGVDRWLDSLVGQPPRKGDQDRLDALLCALIGHHWLTRNRSESVVIGDMASGYMVAPAVPPMRQRLGAAARERAVPVA